MAPRLPAPAAVAGCALCALLGLAGCCASDAARARAAPCVQYHVQAPGASAVDTAGIEQILGHGRLMEVSALFSDALEDVTRALAKAPTARDLLVHRNRLKDVVRYFPSLPDYKTDPMQAAVRQAALAYLAGQDQQAVELAAEALELRPDNVDLQEFLERLEREAALARPVPAQATKPPAAATSAVTRAARALEERLYDEAAALSKEALRRDPDNKRAWQILGASLFALKDLDAALEAWRRVYELELNPTARISIRARIRSIEAARARAEAERTAAGPKPRAAAGAPRPRLPPEQARRLLDAGFEFYLQGRYEEAAGAFTEVLESDPANQEAANAMARVRAREVPGP